MKTAVAAMLLFATTGLGAEKAKPAFRTSPVLFASPVAAEQRSEAQKAHNEALKLLAAGDVQGSRTGFQKVLNLSPNNPAALINLGIVEQRLNNFTEAERVLRRAVQASPTSGAGWLLLGIVSRASSTPHSPTLPRPHTSTRRTRRRTSISPSHLPAKAGTALPKTSSAGR